MVSRFQEPVVSGAVSGAGLAGSARPASLTLRLVITAGVKVSSCTDREAPARAPHPWTPDLTHQPSRDDLVVVIATSPAKPEDLTWVRCQPYDYAIMTKKETSHGMHNLRMNLGFEASAYLQFILLHWDHLPERMVFTHAHQHSWHVAVRYS